MNTVLGAELLIWSLAGVFGGKRGNLSILANVFWGHLAWLAVALATAP